MAGWNDILNEAKDYVDDLELTVGDNKLKLGDLRQLLKGQTETLQSKSKDVADREEKVAEVFARLQEIEDTVARNSGIAVNRAEVTAAADGKAFDYEHDVLFGPLMSEINEAKKIAAESKALVEQVRNSSSAHLAAVYENLWTSEFQRRNWDLEKLQAAKNFAVENSIKKRNGVIDPIRAFTEMTREQTTKVQLEDARKAGEEAGAARARAELGASMLPFGVGMPPPTPGVKIDPKLDMRENIRKNLREVLGKAGMAQQ